MEKVILKRKEHLYETDTQGIVHFANYPKYFEEARELLSEKVNFSYRKLLEEENIAVVIIKLSVDYKRPLFYEDIIEIEVGVKELKRTYFSFVYKVYKENQLMVSGYTKHCCIDLNTGKIVPIPHLLKEALEKCPRISA